MVPISVNCLASRAPKPPRHPRSRPRPRAELGVVVRGQFLDAGAENLGEQRHVLRQQRPHRDVGMGGGAHRDPYPHVTACHICDEAASPALVSNCAKLDRQQACLHVLLRKATDHRGVLLNGLRFMMPCRDHKGRLNYILHHLRQTPFQQGARGSRLLNQRLAPQLKRRHRRSPFRPGASRARATGFDNHSGLFQVFNGHWPCLDLYFVYR